MFTRSELIRFQHCDPAGIVFYPRYVEMINATVEDWFADAIGVSFAQIHMELNVAIPVVALAVDFTAPSHLGETLIFDLQMEHLGTTSTRLAISARCAEAPRLTARLTLVLISKVDYRPKPWPEDLRAKMINANKNCAHSR